MRSLIPSVEILIKPSLLLLQLGRKKLVLQVGALWKWISRSSGGVDTCTGINSDHVRDGVQLGNAFAKSKSVLFPLSPRRAWERRAWACHSQNQSENSETWAFSIHEICRPTGCRTSRWGIIAWIANPRRIGATDLRVALSRRVFCTQHARSCSGVRGGTGNWVRWAREVTRDRRVTGIAFLRGRLRISGLVVENSINETMSVAPPEEINRYAVSLSSLQATTLSIHDLN